MKNRKLWQVGALLVLGLAAGKAAAGYRATEDAVYLFESNGSGLAAGNLAGVRANGTSTDDIGCWLENDAQGNSTGYCKVVKGSVSRTCRFTDNLPSYYFNLTTITAQSRIVFAWTPSNGMPFPWCNYLEVSEDSAYGPKSVL